MFRDCEISHPQFGKGQLDRFLKSLDEIAVIEKDAMLEGRHMTMILAPDKKKIAALARAQAAAAAASGKPVEEEEEDEAVAKAAAEARVVGEDDEDEEEMDDEDTADEAAPVTAGE